jgi:predicted ArsR family transcriptional regulator
MDALSPFELDTILHQPLRTRIAAFLVARTEATFTELKTEMKVTDGNLDSHLKKMVSSGYVRAKKTPAKQSRPTTVYSLTKKGKDSFENYLETLKRVLSMR